MSTVSRLSTSSRVPRLTAIVPSVAGWQSRGRAWVNLVLFGVAALAGTWLVHQTEYLIEYGGRFSSVMATSPHRFYMAPTGILLSLIVGLLLTLTLWSLYAARAELRQHVRTLSPRLARHIPRAGPSVALRPLLSTALALTLVQMTLYVVQENLEYLSTVGTLPWLSVLLAPHHATVMPLHFLISICGSLILWTVSHGLNQARRALRVAEVLLGIGTSTIAPPPRRFPRRHFLPSLRLLEGIFCLRSPPLTI